TILYAVSNVVSQLPTSITGIVLYVAQELINFVVPSASSQAALTILLSPPLADLTATTRQTAISACQMGHAISNILTPTGSVLMASLALAKIPWVKWVKWALPLIFIQFIAGGILLTIAHLFVWAA